MTQQRSTPSWNLRFAGAFQPEDPTSPSEPVTWWLRSVHSPGPAQSRFLEFLISVEIRGVIFEGYSLDLLDPADPTAAEAAGLICGGFGLTSCALVGTVPLQLNTPAAEAGSTADLKFLLDLRNESDPAFKPLRSTLSILEGGSVEVESWDFEGALLGLTTGLPAGTSLRCCATCLYSDYTPDGTGLMGMSCHRDAKEQYLAVRSKRDYRSVPVTEFVPEIYLCEQYEPRIPGTGYRG